MLKHKKIYILVLFLLYTILNSVTLFEPDWSKAEANAYDHMHKDCIVYVEKNGLHSFPFVFGQTMYMYSVDTGKKKAIHRELLPGAKLTNNYTVYKKYVLYEKYDFKGGPSACLEIKDVKQGLTRKLDISESEFAIRDGKLYFSDLNGIYSMRIGDKSKELIIPVKDELSSFSDVRIEDDWLITQDEYYGSMILKNLETDVVYEIESEKDDFYSTMTFIDEEVFLVVLGKSGNLMEIDLNTRQKKLLVNVDKSTQEIAYNLSVVNDIIYCNNQDGDIIAIDSQTMMKSTVIDLSMVIESEMEFPSMLSDDFRVHYSDEYIYIELEFNEDGYNYPLKDILVFNYDGELVYKERVI